MTATRTDYACWTPAWMQRTTGGRWLAPPSDPNQPLTGLGIDTRTLKTGQAFLAVKGENFDGHNFIDKAFKAGAALAIIDREDTLRLNPSPPRGEAGRGADKSGIADQPLSESHATTPTLPQPLPDREGGSTERGILLVDNTVNALHKLARAYRDVLCDADCTVIAVVGSNGKTTTRHLIHAVLSSRLKGTQSPKSFNNHLGVPLTVLGASADDDFLVAEVGTNHPGEIDALGDLLKPDAAVVTSIGHEHLEFFGDLQGVAEEEAAIIPHVSDKGPLFIEADAFEWISKANAFDPKRDTVVYRASIVEGAHSDPVEPNRQRLRFTGSATIDLPLLAPHDATNATAAIEVGRWMKLKDTQIKDALEKVKPMPGRLEVKRFGSVTVIDDTYNANPDSVTAALDVLAGYPVEMRGRRVAVLGDMLELGDLSVQAHQQAVRSVLTMIDAGHLGYAVFLGPLMCEAAQAADPAPPADAVTLLKTPDEAALDAITQAIRPGDTVLCKASRGLQLERLMPMLEEKQKI